MTMPHRTSSPIRLPSASPLLEKVLLFALACCTLSRSWAQDSAFGCYNLPGAERTCTCTDEMCEESACVAAGGLYVAGCATCQCDEGTFEQEGYGCYSIEVNQCDCFPEVCSNETCVMSGGLWTDGCKSCQCGSAENNSGGVEQPSPTEGYGCYDTSVNSCSCLPEVCSEASCEASGDSMVWADGCISCQCVPSSEEESSEGCYNLPDVGRACTCTDEMCDESRCTEAGGIFTSGCKSCACGADPGEAESSATGFGCYSVETHDCICSEELCDENLCAEANRVWTNECRSCSCPNAAFQKESLGCFSIESSQCDCSPEVCNEPSCAASGGVFTDDCLNCMCGDETDDVNHANEDDNADETALVDGQATSSAEISSDSLSAGAIAGVVLGSLAGVGIIAGVISFWMRRRQELSSMGAVKGDVAEPPTSTDEKASTNDRTLATSDNGDVARDVEANSFPSTSTEML